MDITLQYFDGCPSWKLVEADLETLAWERSGLRVTLQLIDTPEAAAEFGFRGSPTVLIDGTDPFSDSDAPVGLSCRVYRTNDGYGGSPSLEQLRTAIGEG